MSPIPAESTPAVPQSSALPNPRASNNDIHHDTPDPTDTQQKPSAAKVKPPRSPVIRLEIRDLSSPGSHAFLRLVHASTALQDAISSVLTHLYTSLPPANIPPTRSITLVLRSMDGVAYTTGLKLDSDHKEIHLSVSYISSVPASRQKEEVLGVLVHETVHCYQHTGVETAPSGLIEGIADWVRLKAGLAPPHWKRDASGDWDAGYERTGYFLEWLEGEFGEDVVRKINEALRTAKYGKMMWLTVCGRGVEELWEEYKKVVGNGDGTGGRR